jgi:anti-sigma factor RsiW
MNADPTDTASPHLDLEDLIAGAAGQPAGERARVHLARCEHCQREASRWNLVADGVRGLTADAPETHQPARPRHTGPRVPAKAWRRTALVTGSAAAALFLFAGVGEVTGFVHIHLNGPGSQTTLTSVTGCTQLRQANGTFRQLDGSSLVITTVSGQQVTVTTTPSTFVSVSGPLLADITDGSQVTVHGSQSGATFTAAIVTVGQPTGTVNSPGSVPVQGTVTDVGHGGFTLVTSSGSRIPVTTTGDTLVVIPHASLHQLQAGTTIFAIGQAGPDGTLAAKGVAAVSQLRSGPHIGVSVADCSSRSVDMAIGVISTGQAG